jgi:hypothetical protein|nr:MAG TPA: ASCH domain protein [Caudoviricetes sp.]
MFNDKFCLTQAVLNGAKTMTRRVLKDNVPLGNWKDTKKHLPYKVGEIVAIAQSYKDIYAEKIEDFAKHSYHIPREDAAKKFRKLHETCAGWTNKMFVKSELMPHHIRIINVKVERLQGISEEDILREGVWQYYDNNNLFYVSKKIGYASDVAFPSARKAFAYLIDMVSGKGIWESNPYVVAYSFELVD